MATILIIEDDPASQELMSYLISAHGYATLEASRGDQGVAMIRESRPDLVVCDIHLPGLDGYEVARAVKATDELLTIPLVAVTALAMVGDREKVLAAGFDSYVTKPIDPQTFVSHIELLLGRSPSTRCPAPPAPVVNAPARLPSRGTLLVVDDSAVNRDLKRSIFEPHGYRVITAETVAAGLQLATEHRPTAIIADVGLPDGSGLDLLKQLKADPRVRDIPVVIITSTHADRAVADASLALGAARFLIRPLDSTSVLSEVESVLNPR
ncbi:MAG: response regulator [Pseudomonadota bacterium]|nr:response regulator [Pseudomonadota bacterium]